MEAPANAVRFVEPFSFVNPTETGQSMWYIRSLSALRSCPPRGTGCAHGLVMLKNTEDLNTQNDALSLIARK